MSVVQGRENLISGVTILNKLTYVYKLINCSGDCGHVLDYSAIPSQCEVTQGTQINIVFFFIGMFVFVYFFSIQHNIYILQQQKTTSKQCSLLS